MRRQFWRDRHGSSTGFSRAPTGVGSYCKFPPSCGDGCAIRSDVPIGLWAVSTVRLADGKDSMNVARRVQDTRGIHSHDLSREDALEWIPHCRPHGLVWIRKWRSLGCGGTRLGPNWLATWRIWEGIQASAGHDVVVNARGGGGRRSKQLDKTHGRHRYFALALSMRCRKSLISHTIITCTKSETL